MAAVGQVWHQTSEQGLQARAGVDVREQEEEVVVCAFPSGRYLHERG